MNYPCNMIRDLMPLYHDGACSEESCSAVKTHLDECPDCGRYYEEICSIGDTAMDSSKNELEQRKANSLKAVKKKIKRGRLIAAAICALVLIVGAAVGIFALKSTVGTVNWDGNISVSMTADGLIARLIGSVWSSAHSKTVTVGAETYLFFYLTDSKWDKLTTGASAFTEYTLCSADKGAEEIDRVYYYTGDYDGIETLDADGLEKLEESSVLLWSK